MVVLRSRAAPGCRVLAAVKAWPGSGRASGLVGAVDFVANAEMGPGQSLSARYVASPIPTSLLRGEKSKGFFTSPVTPAVATF